MPVESLLKYLFFLFFWTFWIISNLWSNFGPKWNIWKKLNFMAYCMQFRIFLLSFLTIFKDLKQFLIMWPYLRTKYINAVKFLPHFVPKKGQSLVNILQFLFNSCINIVQILYNHCANIAWILCKYIANI